MVTDKEIEYLEERLHSPAMKCRQCDITRRLITDLRDEPLAEVCECGGKSAHKRGGSGCVRHG